MAQYPVTTEDGTRTTNVVDVPSSDSGIKRYVALLTQANAILVSGTLTIGKSYTINGYQPGDDFTNVGASDNTDGITFIATGTTPTDWSNGSSLTDNAASAPVATVLENTLGGTPVWSRVGVGYYNCELLNAFPANKTYTPNLVLNDANGSEVNAMGLWLRVNDSKLELDTLTWGSTSFSVPGDHQLNAATAEICVYP